MPSARRVSPPLLAAAALVLVAAVLAPVVAVGQQDAGDGRDDRLGFGLVVVANGATLATDDTPDPAIRFGAGLGGFAAWTPRADWRPGARAELVIMQRGARVESEAGGRVAYEAGYLELPLLGTFSGPTFGRVQPYLVGGGIPTLKIYERQAVGRGLQAAVAGPSFFRRTDASVVGGAGVRIDTGAGTVAAGLRYVHGLTDVVDLPDDPPFGSSRLPPSGRHRLVVLALTLAF